LVCVSGALSVRSGRLLAQGGGIYTWPVRVARARIQHLENLENLSSPPLPCEHFDLIGGTSTGGFVAIVNLNVAASLPFTQTYGLNARATSNVNRRIHQALRLTFRASSPLIPLTRNWKHSFVCAMLAANMTAAIPRLFRTYRVPNSQS
jgi:patatin-like phospholipase/acyl hydrolase